MSIWRGSIVPDSEVVPYRRIIACIVWGVHAVKPPASGNRLWRSTSSFAPQATPRWHCSGSNTRKRLTHSDL